MSFCLPLAYFLELRDRRQRAALKQADTSGVDGDAQEPLINGARTSEPEKRLLTVWCHTSNLPRCFVCHPMEHVLGRRA